MRPPEPVKQREPIPQSTPIALQALSAEEQPGGTSTWKGAPNYGGGVVAGAPSQGQPQGYAPGPGGSGGPGSPASPMASDSPKIYPQMPDGAVVYY